MIFAIWKYLPVSPSSIQLSRRFEISSLFIITTICATHRSHSRMRNSSLAMRYFILLLLSPGSSRSLSPPLHRYASVYARWNRLIVHMKAKPMRHAASVSDFILLRHNQPIALILPITDDALYCPLSLDFRRRFGSIYPSYCLYSLIPVKNGFPQFCRKYKGRTSVSIIMTRFCTAFSHSSSGFHRLYSYDLINFNWLSREWAIPAFGFYENVVLCDISLYCFINFISPRTACHLRI